MNKSIKETKLKNLSWVLAVLFCVIVTNIFTFYISRRLLSCAGSNSLINPYLSCGDSTLLGKQEYTELKTNLNLYIEEQKKEGKVKTVGIWFRDLQFGPTFGINDRIDFIPASLLKLPLAMTFFNLSESDPELFKNIVTYSGIVSVPKQTFIPQNQLEYDKTYTIDELIYRAIVYSDNVAAQLLFDYLNKNYSDNLLSQTYRDLGILEPGTNLDKAVVNTKEYGSIFRMLYNLAYLNQDNSEKLLSILTKADFVGGIRQGIPDGVSVAEKFGERLLDNGEKQLHSCGIIYYPKNPYLLCVMTRGNNFNELKKVIDEISKKVYQEFNSRRINA